MIVVETERLLLRHFHLLDCAALDVVFGDAEVMRFGPGVQDQAWVRNWVRTCLENYYQTLGFGPWAVMEKASARLVGYCGLFYFPDIAGRPEVEIGYRLARAAWGQGYATEAARAVRDYGLEVLGLRRLVAIIDPHNAASLRVAEKIGMHFEQEVMLEGYTYPDHLYVLTGPMLG